MFFSWFLSLHVCVYSWGQGPLLSPQYLEWPLAYCKYPVNICGLNGRLACAPLHVGHIYHGSCTWRRLDVFGTKDNHLCFCQGFYLKLSWSFPVTSLGFAALDPFCEGPAGAGRLSWGLPLNSPLKWSSRLLMSCFPQWTLPVPAGHPQWTLPVPAGQSPHEPCSLLLPALPEHGWPSPDSEWVSVDRRGQVLSAVPRRA